MLGASPCMNWERWLGKFDSWQAAYDAIQAGDYPKGQDEKDDPYQIAITGLCEINAAGRYGADCICKGRSVKGVLEITRVTLEGRLGIKIVSKEG